MGKVEREIVAESTSNAPRRTLFFVSSKIFDVHFVAIRRFLRTFPGGLILSDSADVVRVLARNLRDEEHAFEALSPTEFQPGLDRDMVYGVCEEMFERLIRAYVKIVRENPGALDFEIEKFRSTFLDKFYPMLTGLIASTEALKTPLDEAVFIGEPEDIALFRKIDLGKVGKRSYAVPMSNEVVLYRFVDLDAGLRRLVPTGVIKESTRVLRAIGEGLKVVRREIDRRQVAVRLFGGTFPPIAARSLPTPKRPPKPRFFYRNSDGGGPEFIEALARENFFRPLSELAITPEMKEVTLLFAETQSRPYAEGLAILLENTPPEKQVVVIAPYKAGAGNEQFNATLLAHAGEPVPKSPKGRKTPTLPTPREVLDQRFPNIQFLYMNYPEDGGNINAAALRAYYAPEMAFVKREMTTLLGERYPAFLVQAAIPALERVIEESLRHAFYANEIARDVLIALEGRVSSVVTYSGRVAEGRIAAIEARRHGLPVIDWQCTILGKTPVFFPIIADRVLAICQNAVETYVSYFSVKRENCHLIGFPRFVRTMRSYNPEIGRKKLRQARIDPATPFHIFAAQPLDRTYQKAIFDVLAAAAAELNITVLVCAHPSQRVTGETAFLKQVIESYAGGHLKYADTFSVHELFPLARSTISYSSTFLYEAASVGFKAIVLDPLEIPHVLDYTSSDEVMWAKTAAQLVEKLRLAEAVAPTLENLNFDMREKDVCVALWKGFSGR
jgi:hypothetical protein